MRQELKGAAGASQVGTGHRALDRRTHRYHQVVFPQMASWLPDDEAEQLCFEFAEELKRIEALLAA